MNAKLVHKLCAVIVMVSLVLGLGVTGTPSARASSRADCSTSKEIGGKVPLLMVHGFAAGPDTWSKGSPSMESIVNMLTGVYVEPAFNYAESNTAWVTDSNIGPKLAKRIDCLAQASRKGGGSGKVIVVAHSMGGLATRYASGQRVDGRKVSDELGLVVMIGTPSLGSWGGNACKIATGAKLNLRLCEGEAPEAMASITDELKALPKLPANVAVKTIAGDVTVQAQIFFTQITAPTLSDLLVSVPSALDGSTRRSGGGQEIVHCFGITAIPEHSGAPCEHGALPSNSKVQASVKASIRTYLASVPPKVAFTGKLVLNSLQIPTLSKWEVRGKEDYPEGNEGAVFDMTTCKRTSEGDYWKACARFFVNLGGPIQGGGNLQWWLDLCPGTKLMEKGAKVGSLKADVYKVTKCDGDFELLPYLYLWHIPGKGSIVVEPSLEGREMQGMREAFAAAVWK